jgi:hypothetical protein
MKKMNVRAKFNGGAVHLGGSEFTNGRWSPACGMQHHNVGGRTPSALYPTEDAVTCKRCLKVIAKDAEKTQAQTPAAPEIKPGRCLQRVGKVGATPTQCVKPHAHEDDHEDRFGETYRNHAVVPGAEPLSPTAQALADASTLRDKAMKAAYDAEGTELEAVADAVYESADAVYKAAQAAHSAAREAAGDFLPRAEREARKVKPFTLHYDAAEGVYIAAALREKAQAERELSKELRVEYDGVGAGQADNRAGLLDLVADRVHTPVKAALADDMGRALDAAEKQAKPSRAARLIQDAIGLRW